MTDKPYPVQPVVTVDGVVRFKANPIVRDLLDFASERGLDLNALAGRKYSREDHEQFAQLIGYSLSGAADLSYMSDATLEVARRSLDDVADPKISDALLQFGSVVGSLRALIEHEGGAQLSVGVGHAMLVSDDGRISFAFSIVDVVNDKAGVLNAARTIILGAWR